MAYQIDRYNGTFLISIDDQTINSTATDLRLVGRNYSGYGEIQNENLLHLLENFANTSAPPRAILGQLWYDSTNKKIKLYDGTKFKPVGGAESSATAPAGFSVGDFWWDNQNEQINVWNGSEFVVVGPERSPVYGDTSTTPAVVKDTVGTDQQIIKFQVGGEVLAILSRATFTLNQTFNPISGFSQIKPGINFINSGSTGETISSHRFWGTAANAEKLGGFAVTDFIRSGNSSFDSQVNFKDSGFTVGDQSDFRIRILNGNSTTIESTINQPIIVRISNNEGDIRDVAVIKGTGIEPGSTGLYDLGSVAAKWKTVNAEEVKATTFYGKLVGTVETAPGPGGVVPPLSIQSVAVSGSFNMSASGGAGASNFSVNLAGSSSAVNLSSGTVGSLDNFNIGGTTPGSARVTTFNTTGSTTLGSTLSVTDNATMNGTLTVAGNVFFIGTGALKVPTGVSGLRPPAPSQGMIRFNSTDTDWEGYNGSEWVSLGGGTDEDYGLITTSVTSTVDYGDLS
jgi:hypothetical protein